MFVVRVTTYYGLMKFCAETTSEHGFCSYLHMSIRVYLRSVEMTRAPRLPLSFLPFIGSL